MPRIRTLKPELPQDAKLAQCTREARYTFVLLITQADDYGLLAAAPRQLLGSLYPHDEDVSSGLLRVWLDELVRIGAVRWRETDDGAPVVEIMNWSKHQRVDNRGRSVLAATLKPVAEPRGEIPRDAEKFGLDLGPRTMEQEEGPRDVRGDDGVWLERLGPDGLSAFLAYRRGHRIPAAFEAALVALAPGGTREMAGWPALGRALAQMAGNGDPWNEARFRGYVRKDAAGVPGEVPAEPAMYLENGVDYNPEWVAHMQKYHQLVVPR